MWERVYFCVGCDVEIDPHYKTLCPNCGRYSNPWRYDDSYVPVLEHYSKSRRWIRDSQYRWWNPFTWFLGYWEYGKQNDKY